jgi:hypothetical protein
MLVFDPQLPRQSGMPVVGNGKEMIVRRNGVNPVEVNSTHFVNLRIKLTFVDAANYCH